MSDGPAPPLTREQVIERARRLREDVASVFEAAANWNLANPDQPPIDPDQDGRLRQMLDALDEMLYPNWPKQPQ
jgi:hypothetical protein